MEKRKGKTLIGHNLVSTVSKFKIFSWARLRSIRKAKRKLVPLQVMTLFSVKRLLQFFKET